MAAPSSNRLRTGVPGLDALLGGGLLPGTLTVVLGATGIGKTQLGLQFAQAGLDQEQRAGVLFDMSSRGDSQSHAEYAERMFQRQLVRASNENHLPLDSFFEPSHVFGDYLHVFDYSGRRVTKRDLEFEQWHEWQAELNHKLRAAIAFLYGNFTRGVRRLVIDGVEPTDRAQESIQFNLFEYVYHQVLRKDPEWVARDLFRERYRACADAVARHAYEPARIGCLLLATSHEVMLDDLISRPIAEGDPLANANTLVYMGKVRSGCHLERALYVAKHRGSACSESIHPYRISDGGLSLE